MVYFFQALATLCEPLNFTLLFLSCTLGIVFGIIPGLNNGTGVSILLPLTFGLSLGASFGVLIGMYVGAVSGGFVSACLIGIPGTPASIATCFDGHPMCKNGQSSKALGAGVIASFIGTFFSVLVAMSLAPVIASFAMTLGPWEFFSLCLCAILLVVSLSKGNMFQGIAAACIGMLLSTVGISPMDGMKRFVFGSIYLAGGIDLVSFLLAVFAIKMIIFDTAKGILVSPKVTSEKIIGLGVSIKELLANTMNIFRSYMIGLWIGFLPGMGSGLANLVAYNAEKSASKTPEKFGTGYINGVIAPEVANNASIGGAIIPMLSMGIPGDGSTALLMGAMIMKGLVPGPLLVRNNPEVAYLIFAAVALCSVVVLFQQMVGIRLFPHILRIPYHYLYGVIMIVCFLGAYVAQYTIFNMFLMFGLALLAIPIEIAKLPTSPMILGFILGPLLESNLRKALGYGNNSLMPFVTRPISAIFILVALISVLWPFISPYILRLFKKKSSAV